MRNKYLILAAIVTLVLMLGLLIFLVLFSGSPTATEGDPFFGESGDRDVPFETSFWDTAATTTEPIAVGTALGKFRLLADAPVAGVAILPRVIDGEVVPVARYMDRGTAHIYDIDITREDAAQAVALTTLPRIYESLFLASGSTTVLRYTDEGANLVYSYLATLEASATSTELVAGRAHELRGSFLPEGIRTVAVSPTKDAFFFLEPYEGGARGYVRTLGQSGGTKLVWEYPLRELRAQWATPDTVLLTTLASAQTSGHVLEVRVSTGASKTVVGNKLGLTALGNPTGEWLLYTDNDEGFPVTRVLNRTTNETTVAPFTTLPEKCVWSTRSPSVVYCAAPEGIPNRTNFPDNWYRGQLTLRDSLWRYDVATNLSSFLDEPAEALGFPVDLHHLSLDQNDAYLLFRTRSDDLLWAYTLPPSQPENTEAVGEAASSDI